MKIKFYGTRGSIPVPEKDFMEFGGNTACLLITFDSGHRTVFDAGSGIRKLGKDLIGVTLTQDRLFIVLSHTHWDHIQGIPFFAPAFCPHYPLTFVINRRSHLQQNLSNIISDQMRYEYFPVGVKEMQADIQFWDFEHDVYEAGWGGRFENCPLNHPGTAYGYRCENKGKVVVYCTDVEHSDGIDANVVHLARNADLLIHDAQYTPDELLTRKGWGHSSWEQAVEVALRADVKRLALFHHDPEHDDAFLHRMEQQCQQIFPNSFFARESMEVEV